MHKNYAKEIYNEIISHGPSMREIFEYSNQVQNKVVYTKKFYMLGYHIQIIYDLNAKDGYDITIYPSLCDIFMLTATQQVVGLLVKLDKNKEPIEIRINSEQDTKNRLEALDKNNTNDIGYIRFILPDNNRKLDPFFLINIKDFYYNNSMTKDDLRPWGETTIAEEGKED